MPVEFDPSFKTLTPVQTGLPYALKDLFAYVADEKTRNEAMVSDIAATIGQAASGFDYLQDADTHRRATEHVALCDNAIEVLNHYRDTAKAQTVLLDVRKDVVMQLAGMLPQLKK